MKCVSTQMRNLFCKRLAACLGVHRPSSTTPEPLSMKTKGDDVDFGIRNNDDHRVEPSSVHTADDRNKSVKKLLQRICELLETGAGGSGEQEDERRTDWKLAAAVFDRICAFVFTVCFVGGTVVMFVLIAVQP